MPSPSNAIISFQESACPHISNLLYTIRRANNRYSKVAAALRNSLRPTYHARKRARSLRLRVSIEAALNLDPKQISTIPLPIIEVVTPLHQVLLQARPLLRCDIPQNVNGGKMLSSVSIYSDVSLNTPASLSEPLTSRWSMTTIDTDLEDEIVEEDISFSSDHEDIKGLPISLVTDTKRTSLERSTRRPSFSSVSVQYPPRLDVPVDVSRFSWSSYLSSGLSSGSSSSSSSSGPATPGTYTQPQLNSMTCIKRKSKASDIDFSDILEKRPKYSRKSWVNIATERIIKKMPATAARRY